MSTPKTIGFFTSQLTGEVILRENKNGEGNQAPLTIHELVLGTATRYPDLIALGTRNVDGWETITYIEYYELCRKAAKSFLKLGLERFHGVGILGYNCTRWFVADIASIFAGGISVGIFPNNSSQACRFIAENSEANIFMVENDWQLQKILKVQDHLRHLKAIVQYKDKLTKKLPNTYTWEEFLTLGVTISDEMLDKVIDSQKPNQCCMLVYTMGTTGPPKAVMLSHDNITWTSAAVLQSLPYTYPPENQEVLVSYLPLCLINAQIFEIWIPVTIGASIFFAEPDAMKIQGSLINTLLEVRPTTFCGVPEVWEELMQRMRSDQMSAASFKRNLIVWARKMGLKAYKNRESDCGKAIAGSHNLVRNTDQEDIGEFYLWGRHLSMGYLNNEYKTKKAFDQKGWLHTGDLGTLDNEGFIHIIGRIEEVIITNQGEKIFPVPMENMLKENIPIIHHAIIVGNQAKFLSVLLTLKCEISSDTGEPHNMLTQEVINFCRKNNSKSVKVTDITNNQDPIIDAIIQKGIDAINEQPEHENHKILKWKVLEKDFSIMGGELGSFHKH
ncbi:long-chain-fatty-acid--CoA ligase ACSBG2-like isoform X2 [Phascolarctos cinereus]